MSFQRPEFLLALLLALLPAAFYLSRYVRSTRTIFPAAHYLFGRDKAPLARLRSRQIVATLLRAGIICLAALAFAGPVLPERTQQVAPPQGIRTVLIIDTSASMMARTEDGKTALAAVVAQAQAVLQETGEESRVAVVPCPRPQETMLWLPKDRAALTLARLEPSWLSCQPTSLLDSLLISLPIETQFHLFSDLGLNDDEWTRLATRLESAQNVTVHTPPSAATANRSVVDVWSEAGGVGILVGTSEAELPASTATVTCPDYEATVPVPPLTPAGTTILVPVPADVPPGLCQVTLSEDASGHDNSGWFETGSLEPTRVLIVDGSPSHTVVASPGGFLTASLRAGEVPVRLVHLAQTEFSYDSLRLADLLVLVDPRPLPAYLEKGLVEFMARGGHVWLFAGSAMAEWKSDNLLLPGLQSRRCAAIPEQPFHLTWASPDDAAVAAIRALPEASIRVWSHVRHTALTFLGREVSVLARFDDGVPMVVRVPFARGQLLLWSLVPAVDNGNFALHPAFPLTVQAVFGQLAHPVAEVRVPRSCRVGEPCEVAGLTDESDDAHVEGGMTSRRVTVSRQNELICPEPGPYFLPGPEGRKLAFVCRTHRTEAATTNVRQLPGQEHGVVRSGGQPQAPSVPVAQLLLLAALALVFVELWMVSGRLKDRYEA